MDDQKSLEAQLLGDMGYEDPRKASQPQIQYQELSEEQIAILQQQRAAKGQPPYTDEEIAELKADFIERQRTQAMQAAMAAQAQAQQAAAAALLAEPEDYSQPERKPQHEALPQVDASALLEEPAPEPERKVVFNQEDLQAAKMSAAKRASESLKEIPAQTPEQQKRAREEMALLRLQQQEELAAKGFTVAIVLTILGVLAGACTILFSAGAYPDPTNAPGVFKFFDTCYLILGLAMVGLAITILLRVRQTKGLASAIFAINAILMLLPGVVSLLSEKKNAEGGAIICAGYIVSIILSIVVVFIMSTSDKIAAYYKKSEIMYE